MVDRYTPPCSFWCKHSTRSADRQCLWAALPVIFVNSVREKWAINGFLEVTVGKPAGGKFRRNGNLLLHIPFPVPKKCWEINWTRQAAGALIYCSSSALLLFAEQLIDGQRPRQFGNQIGPHTIRLLPTFFFHVIGSVINILLHSISNSLLYFIL